MVFINYSFTIVNPIIYGVLRIAYMIYPHCEFRFTVTIPLSRYSYPIGTSNFQHDHKEM